MDRPTIPYPFPRILVPLDGSNRAERAIDHARQIVRHDGEIILLHVLDHMGSAGDEVLLGLDHLREQIAADHPNLTVSIAVEQGEPIDAIVAVAMRQAVSAILLAPRDTPPDFMERTAASVSERVSALANIPVMIVHDSPPDVSVSASPVKRVLAPIDGSLRALNGLAVAASVATWHDVPVHLVTVVDPTKSLPPAYAYSSPDLDPDRQDAVAHLKVMAAEALHQAGRQLHCANVPYTAEVVEGKTLPTLLTRIEDGDLVVISSRGAGGANRSRFGSTARKLLRLVRAPVIVYHADLPAVQSLCHIPPLVPPPSREGVVSGRQHRA